MSDLIVVETITIVDLRNRRICKYVTPNPCLYSELTPKQYIDVVNAANTLWNAPKGSIPRERASGMGFTEIYIFDHDKKYQTIYYPPGPVPEKIGLKGRLYAAASFDIDPTQYRKP